MIFTPTGSFYSKVQFKTEEEVFFRHGAPRFFRKI
mgnify:CR=1 FL=1